jgi:hypothetical protein
MRSLLRRVLPLLLVSLVAPFSFAQLPDVVVLTAGVDGASVIPDPGSSTGKGFVRLDVGSDASGFQVAAIMTGVVPATLHLHRGGNGVEGELALDLTLPFDLRNTASGFVRAPAELMEELRRNPAAFYVDLHRNGRTEAALRGQLQYATVGEASVAGPFTSIAEPADSTAHAVAYVDVDRQNGALSYALIARDSAAITGAYLRYERTPGEIITVGSLAPVFHDGVAIGRATGLNAAVLHQPHLFFIDITTAAHPNGAFRAPVGSEQPLRKQVIPVVGRTAGANGTFFRTKVSLTNPSERHSPVVLHYFPSGENGSATPAATFALALAPGEERTFTDAELLTAFGVAEGTGALRVDSLHPLTVIARVYNDQRATDRGTFSQSVLPREVRETFLNGVLPMLANQQGQSGYRTNVGWFNAGDAAVNVTFRAHRPNGTVLATVVRSVPAGQQLQFGLSSLFPNLEPLDRLYVSFSSTAPLHVYASVIDNTNGDAIYIPGQPR